MIFPDADVLGGGASAPFSAGLQSSGELDGELVMAGARAHNRWLAELCSDSPERRCGVATVPILHDVPAAVEEMHRVADAGLRAAMIPTLWGSKPAYHDPIYEPVWAAAEDLGLVVNIHSGGSSKDILPGPGMVPDLRHRGMVVGGPAAVGAAVERRVRPPPRPAVRGHRGRRLVAGRHRRPHGREVGRWPQHAQVRRPLPQRGRAQAERVPRHERVPRRLHAQPLRDRLPRPHRRAHDAVGQRLPPSRGHLAPHPPVDPRRLPRRASGGDSPDARAHRSRGLPLRPRRSWPTRSPASAPPTRRSTA